MHIVEVKNVRIQVLRAAGFDRAWRVTASSLNVGFASVSEIWALIRCWFVCELQFYIFLRRRIMY